MRSAVASLVLALACGGPALQPLPPQVVVICPQGSAYDQAMNACVARPPLVIASNPQQAVQSPIASSDPPIAPLAPIASASASAIASATVIAPPLQPVPTPPGSFAVEVTCAFPNGWVSVLPTSAYPRDDEFLMQALIGFTTEPTFWDQEREYRPLKKWAAKPCNAATPTRFFTSGDVYIVAGQANTFNTRGKYDKNGFKKRMTITASTTLAISPALLTHTWDCISCPWLAFDGSDTSPFVVLAFRDDEKKSGADRREARHVPVKQGRIVARVSEIEDEETHLDQLLIVIRDASGAAHVIAPLGGDHSALSRDDGVEVRMTKGSQIIVSYDVSRVLPDGSADVDVIASGYYVPTP